MLLERGKWYRQRLVARMIHDLSPRTKAPFVEVNCGGSTPPFSIPSCSATRKAPPLMPRTEQGLFEIADHGTIFLDEIGDLAPELQPKLLKVLETKTFRRLGGTREITVDVRLVAATNKNLQAEVETGRFREDLYYRLSVMPLTMPALRDRSREDRLALITRLMGDLRAELPDGPPSVTGEVLERLLSYPWPGNVREMRNVLERALILGRGQPAVSVEHLPGEFRARAGVGDRRHTPLSLEDLERQHIERTLKHHTGNRTRAAIELGISRATLINKIKRYNIVA